MHALTLAGSNSTRRRRAPAAPKRFVETDRRLEAIQTQLRKLVLSAE
jgi:hypothetical protein